MWGIRVQQRPEPHREGARLRVLAETGVCDGDADSDLDDIAALAGQVCSCPIAFVTLVDDRTQWFKARVGCHLDRVDRADSFCSHAIVGPDLLEVPDARLDTRFASMSMVSGPPHIRFYAGAPIRVDGGHLLGTVCVLDTVARSLTEAQRRALRCLARHAAAELELRRFANLTPVPVPVPVPAPAPAPAPANDLDATMDRFIATVGHELRTPLTSIRGYLELLADNPDADPETTRRFIDVMQRNTERLGAFVDDVVLVGRAHADGLTMQLTATDLADVACRATDAAASLAEQKRVSIQTDAATAAPVLADPTRLGQAVDHLVLNAIKFTPPDGKVSVTVSAGPDPTLRITDTGVGVAHNDLPNLFKRFYRTTTADTIAAQGAGIGLTIVKAIIDAHHGTIAITSDPGRGTEVQITLPARGRQ